MPIDYDKYPPNWDEIRQRILVRAKFKCECCGFENKQIVRSIKEKGKPVIWRLFSEGVHNPNAIEKAVKVVLTIAHLDHDEENHDVTDERLKAMCQLCHLRYDSKEKQRRKQSKLI